VLLELRLAGAMKMEHISLEAVLDQSVIRDHGVAKSDCVVVTGVAGEGRSRSERQKYDRGAGELQILLHLCPILNS
jgi:hypothetical protein